MSLVAEGFGVAAVVLNFIGYRQQHINGYRAISAMALACVSVHFFMLDALAAGIGCALACVRNIIAIRYRHAAIVLLFVALNLFFLAYEWFYLEHGAMIFVAYASSLIFTVGTLMLQDADKLRRWFISAEVLGLLYALSVGSVFGSVFNISNLMSIALKMRKK